ncbi:MAG: hypothetical protein RLZZ540_667 [Bacteroidota bacterium]|jgi:6-pyruvoyl-tetrahydropterin synthase
MSQSSANNSGGVVIFIIVFILLTLFLSLCTKPTSKTPKNNNKKEANAKFDHKLLSSLEDRMDLSNHPEAKLATTMELIEKIKWPELKQYCRDNSLADILKQINDNRDTINKRKQGYFNKALDNLIANPYEVLIITKQENGIGLTYVKKTPIDRLQVLLNKGEIIAFEAILT